MKTTTTTTSRYLVQKRVHQQTINSGGYPDGPLAWSGWGTVVDFEVRQRAINIANLLGRIVPIGSKAPPKDVEFRCFDSLTGQTLVEGSRELTDEERQT